MDIADALLGKLILLCTVTIFIVLVIWINSYPFIDEEKGTMRSVTLVALVLTVALVFITIRYCDGANIRNQRLLEDEEEFRPVYRDYDVMRSRAARAYDAFDDYGHLRFGRSED